MNFKDKELIIFDFDGTLINSIQDIAQAINRMLSHYNFSPLTVEQVTPFVGNGAKMLVKRALEQSTQNKQISSELFEQAFKVYLSAYQEAVCDETYTYPGVVETLNFLNEKGYKMVICSNKPYRFIEPILEKLSIKQFFKQWIGEDSISEKKPNAAPLFHLANEMKTMIENA